MTHHAPAHIFCADDDTAAEILPTQADLSRHDGWSPARQAVFLRELAATHSVAAAARVAGMSRQSAYRLRARLKGQPFDMAWDAAFQSSFDALAEKALERAMNGVEVPHYHQGEIVGTSRKFDERLTLGLLAMRGTFLRPAPAPFHASAGYSSDDLRNLIKRVEHGDETWEREIDFADIEDDCEACAALEGDEYCADCRAGFAAGEEGGEEEGGDEEAEDYEDAVEENADVEGDTEKGRASHQPQQRGETSVRGVTQL